MEADFSGFFSEDGPGLGLENLPDHCRDEGEEPPSSDEESCASSEHHSDNESVGYSVGEYEREREGTWKREGDDDMSLSSDESEDEDEEGGALPEPFCQGGRRGRATTAYRTPTATAASNTSPAASHCAPPTSAMASSNTPTPDTTSSPSSTAAPRGGVATNASDEDYPILFANFLLDA